MTTNYYIVKKDGKLALAIYGSLEIALSDKNVELLHYNPYHDRVSAVRDLNYFLNQELETTDYIQER